MRKDVLERFDAGLWESGHTNEILDLYAIGFDPILRERDDRVG
jgi:NAD(P)H dehydrogenase (quinone)